jgi:Fe-S-cluster containining protein
VSLACRAGCSLCCQQHLSVYAFEFELLAEAVDALSQEAREAIKQRVAVGKKDPRCPLLDDTGRCRVYAVRPLICRSHGLPILVGPEPSRDVCPLNFNEEPRLADLPDADVLNVNSVNAILAVIDHVEHGGKGERVPLLEGLKELLSES